MKRGKLVVLCGIDGCGKSTIMEDVCRDNTIKNYLKMRHPPKEWYENPKICAAYLDGDGIKIQDEEEIAITHGLRKKEEKEYIIPNLLAGSSIIFHRYIFSLYAYYYGIKKFGIEELNQYFKDILLPDQVIYLKISVDEFYKRFVNKEQLSYQKNPDYIKRVMQCYETLAKHYNWTIIDTEHQTVKESTDQVIKIINNLNVDHDFKSLNLNKYII